MPSPSAVVVCIALALLLDVALASDHLWNDEAVQRVVSTRVPWRHSNAAQNSVGPTTWSSIVHNGTRPFTACAGHSQSPVDLSNVPTNPTLRPLDTRWGESYEFSITNTGNSMIIKFDERVPSITDPNTGVEYDFVAALVHTPAEHMIGGGRCGMEVQLMHRRRDTDPDVDADDDLGRYDGHLGISILYCATAMPNEYLANFWGSLPSTPVQPAAFYSSDPVARAQARSLPQENTVRINRNLSLAKLLPDARDYYMYRGSTTAPPCTEKVTWYVMAEPVGVSKEQVRVLRVALAVAEEAAAAKPVDTHIFTVPGNARKANKPVYPPVLETSADTGLLVQRQPAAGTMYAAAARFVDTLGAVSHAEREDITLNDFNDVNQTLSIVAVVLGCISLLVAVVAFIILFRSMRGRDKIKPE